MIGAAAAITLPRRKRRPLLYSSHTGGERGRLAAGRFYAQKGFSLSDLLFILDVGRDSFREGASECNCCTEINKTYCFFGQYETESRCGDILHARTSRSPAGNGTGKEQGGLEFGVQTKFD